jgi:hypothetical protein
MPTTRRRLAKKVSSLRGSSAKAGAGAGAGAAAAAGDATENKFNLRNNKRLKHEVAGRKIRGQSSNVPEVRARQESERKNTLLVEYNNLNRANAFVDKRVGELVEGLSQEDKALMRYQRQRQKQFAKTSRFNLDDSDEEDKVETYGQSLGSWEEDASGRGGDGSGGGGGGDEDEGGDDEYEPDEEMGGFRLKSKAGGPPQENKGAKTKREMLAEVISKNRFYRAQRAQDKEAFEDEVDELDEGLDDMMTLLKARSDDARKLQKEQRRRGSEAAVALAAAVAAGATGQIAVAAYDDYDQSRRAMENEARVAASAKRQDNPQTRMKEARQKLMQHERLRLDSLAAAGANKLAASSGSGGVPAAAVGAASHTPAPSGSRATAGKKQQQQQQQQPPATTRKGSVRSAENELEEETNSAGAVALATRVPFTPDCPQSSKELASRIEEYCGDSTEDLDTYLRHVRIMHSIVHDPQTNGRKLTVLLGLLVDEFVASLAQGGGMGGAERARTLSLHIWKIAQEVPLPAAKVFVAAVERTCCGAAAAAGDDGAAFGDARDDNSDDSDGDSADDNENDNGASKGRARRAMSANSSSSGGRLGVPQLGLLRLAITVFDLEWSGRFLRQVILLVLGRALLQSGRTPAPETLAAIARQAATAATPAAAPALASAALALPVPVPVPVQDLWRGLCAAALALDAADRAKVDTSQIDESRDGGELGVIHAAPDFVPEVVVFLHAAVERLVFVCERDVLSLGRRSGGGGRGGGGGGGRRAGDGGDDDERKKPCAAGTRQLRQAGMLCFGSDNDRPREALSGAGAAVTTAGVASNTWRWKERGGTVADRLDQAYSVEAPVDTWTSSLLLRQLLEAESAGKQVELAAVFVTPAAVGATLAVLERAMRKWTGLPSFPEMFAPFVSLLQRLHRVARHLASAKREASSSSSSSSPSLPSSSSAAAASSGADSAKGAGVFSAQGRLLENCGQLLDQLQRRLGSSAGARKALTRARMVKAVEQYAPAFDETGFNPKKSNDPAADYMKGLKQKARQERKNAARELRRDSAFVAGVRDEQHAKRDLRVKRKVNEAMAFLQNQEATFKQMVKTGTTRGAGSGGGGVKKKKRF